MGRTPCCSKEGLNKGAWTAVEDKILTDYIKTHGEGKWRNIPKQAGLKRCGKSCRLRWMNYLRPDIKRGNISHEEEDLIIRLHKLLGNRWSLIAGRLPGRTDNEIKNYWNTTLVKKVQGVQSKYCKDEKKKTQIKLSDTIQTPSAVKSSVIRTKASRCTKVLVTQTPGAENMASKVVTEAPVGGGFVANEDVGSKTTNTVLSAATQESNMHDLTMDFSVEEFLLSDISDSEIWKLCQVDNDTEEVDYNLGAISCQWPSILDQPLMLSDENFEGLNH